MSERKDIGSGVAAIISDSGLIMLLSHNLVEPVSIVITEDSLLELVSFAAEELKKRTEAKAASEEGAKE